MAHHLVERRKELKRRRKKRRERLKERNKKAAILKSAMIIPCKIPKEPEAVTPIPTKSVITPTTPVMHPHETYLTEPAVIAITPVTPARKSFETDWGKAHSITELIKLLPTGIKTKKIWPAIPEQLKEEIIKWARHMAESRNFAAPAEWDGSLKQALLLMDSGRLPNGFRIYLGL